MKRKPRIKCVFTGDGSFAFFVYGDYKFLEWNTVQKFKSLKHLSREYEISPSDVVGYELERLTKAYNLERKLRCIIED